jgi:GGDEF domain-containing protein
MLIKYKITLAIIITILITILPLSLFILKEMKDDKIAKTIQLGTLNTNLLAKSAVDIIIKNPTKDDLISAKLDSLELLKIFDELKQQGLVFSEIIRISNKDEFLNGTVLAINQTIRLIEKNQTIDKFDPDKKYTKKQVENLSKNNYNSDATCMGLDKTCFEFTAVGKIKLKTSKINSVTEIPLVLVMMQFSKEFILKPIKRLRNLILLAALIATVFSFLIGFIASIFITRKFYILIAGVENYGRGDLNFRVDLKTHSELAHLVNAFNKMAQEIQEKVLEIEDHRDNLEKKVYDRTKELKESRDLLEQYSIDLQNEKKLLEKISITDELTKIFNRRYILKNLNDELGRSKRYNHQLSIAIIDIDHFKKINDSYGHQEGDIVLERIAGQFVKSIRETDSKPI